MWFSFKIHTGYMYNGVERGGDDVGTFNIITVVRWVIIRVDHTVTINTVLSTFYNIL